MRLGQTLGEVPGAGIEACWGAMVAMELKNQCPSLPLTLQLPPEPLSGDQEKTICALQRGTTVSGQEKPLEVQRFCPVGIGRAAQAGGAGQDHGHSALGQPRASPKLCNL